MDVCCACAENTGESGAPEKADGGFFWRLGTCLVLAGLTMLLEIGLANSASLGEPLLPSDPAYWWIHGGMIAAALIALLLLGIPMLRTAASNALQRKFSLESLFLLSATGAFIASFAASLEGNGRNVYYTTVAVVMVIYSSGKQLRQYSREKARTAARQLRDRFSTARIQTADGSPREKPVAELTQEYRVMVAPGDAITVDGTILEGQGFLQETTLTGEPLPVSRGPGETVLAGTLSLDGNLLLQPAASGNQSRQLDTILSAVEQAVQTPSRLQAQADRIMRYFLPAVLAAAVLTFATWWYFTDFSSALFHAMAVLLIACPCALGLATPVALWSGLYRLSQFGLVSRSADLIEHLALANHFAFDKTGTLSHEEITLSTWHYSSEWETRSDLLRALVATAQARQNHPVAQAFQRDLATAAPAALPLLSLQTIPGRGIEAHLQTTNGTIHCLQIGSLALFPSPLQQAFATQLPHPDTPATRHVYLAVDAQPAALVLLEEKLRADAATVLKELRTLGTHSTILTGDTHPRWSTISEIEVLAGLTPLAKENHIRQWTSTGEHVLFVGDGINDSAAMARANAGIAMGSGTDLTRATAHGVLVGNSLSALPPAVRVSRRILRTLRANLRYAIGYNSVGMTLAALGWLNPVFAAVIMLLSSTWVSWRALRAAEIT